ncbi:hypothetical protein [uncultured Sunxiuqinia sp.]|uniref:hypothetical protein n=1 Tax=uncultured Sunxiuqinia sp. TaxID=1573825 RepID=UPI002632D62A|nr:hypothetical protein [uncultured Sunxiuqinia sp.]
MENNSYRQERKCSKERKSDGSFLGTVLIIVGVLWILKEFGWHIGLPGWHAVREGMSNFFNIFHVGAVSITWPVILLIVGVLLLAGRRLVGALLLVLAVLFVLPHVIIPGILTIVFFPIILVVVGIILISKIL